jgi:hypothetical protein
MSSNLTPRSGRIDDAVARSGIGRSKLYQYAAEHPGLFRKNCSAIIVDYAALDALIAALPIAKLKPRPTKKAAGKP